MQRQAILFGSIGALVDTAEIERAAYNQAFSEEGLDWHWSRADYKAIKNGPEGRQCIEDFAADQPETINPFGIYQRKTEIFSEVILQNGLAPRPGVVELIGYAKQNDVKLALCCTAARDNLEMVFNALDGALHRSFFDFAADTGTVASPKPSPEIYLQAMEKLSVAPAACLAIEDTPFGARTAQAAGLDYVAFPAKPFTEADFAAPLATVSHLRVDLLDYAQEAA